MIRIVSLSTTIQSLLSIFSIKIQYRLKRTSRKSFALTVLRTRTSRTSRSPGTLRAGPNRTPERFSFRCEVFVTLRSRAKRIQISLFPTRRVGSRYYFCFTIFAPFSFRRQRPLKTTSQSSLLAVATSGRPCRSRKHRHTSGGYTRDARVFPRKYPFRCRLFVCIRFSRTITRFETKGFFFCS